MAKNTYASKKRRWQKRLKKLVPELQSIISLRNVDAAGRLSTRDQRTLAEAIRRGLSRRQPTAIRYLRAHPGASAEQVLAKAGKYCGPESQEESINPTTQETSKQQCSGFSSKNNSALADLLREFGLQKNRVVAEMVAGADYMSGVLDVVLALERVWEPQGAESETVTVVLCAIAVRLVEQLNTLLEENYSHKMAVLQTGSLGWDLCVSALEKKPPSPHNELRW